MQFMQIQAARSVPPGFSYCRYASPHIIPEDLLLQEQPESEDIQHFHTCVPARFLGIFSCVIVVYDVIIWKALATAWSLYFGTSDNENFSLASDVTMVVEFVAEEGCGICSTAIANIKVNKRIFCFVNLFCLIKNPFL